MMITLEENEDTRLKKVDKKINSHLSKLESELYKEKDESMFMFLIKEFFKIFKRNK